MLIPYAFRYQSAGERENQPELPPEGLLDTVSLYESMTHAAFVRTTSSGPPLHGDSVSPSWRPARIVTIRSGRAKCSPTCRQCLRTPKRCKLVSGISSTNGKWLADGDDFEWKEGLILKYDRVGGFSLSLVGRSRTTSVRKYCTIDERASKL